MPQSNNELAEKIRWVLFNYPGEGEKVYQAVEALGTLVERANSAKPERRKIDDVEEDVASLASAKLRG